jgi:hypothetical protein
VFSNNLHLKGLHLHTYILPMATLIHLPHNPPSLLFSPPP